MGPKYCPKCGALNRGDAQFCNKCGAQLVMSTTASKSTSEQLERPKKTTSNRSIILLVFGWISAAVALFFVPLIFGGIGIALGFAERRVNRTQGTILIVASIICGIAGIIVGAIVGSQGGI
ncbi:MAG: zinc-ribbon domain-containing protein [Lactobacillus sp.]|nr:MAG: zinc-ribbon domain-containing protein [Lactobacillus sp.]